MTPREFLDQIVKPSLAEQSAGFGDLRLAFNAILAVDALAAHIFVWCQANAPQVVAGLVDDDAFRRRLRAQSRDFELISDAAKAGKHVKLTRGQPSVHRADQVKPRTVGYGEGRWGDARWGSPLQVMIEPTEDAAWGVEGLLARAVAFLEAQMAAAGIP